ncbi:MAG: hypothetical protein V3W45_04200 [Sedimentisphaerales bacterium]
MPKQTQSNPILSAIAFAKADSKGAPVPPCGDAGQGDYKMLAKLAKIGKDGTCNGMFLKGKKDAAKT